MAMRRKKLIKRILRALDEPAPLNNNKGPLIREYRKWNKKDRRHDGRVTPPWTKGTGMKYKDAIQEGLEPQDIYDEWSTKNDGMKDVTKDASHFKKGLPRYFKNNPYVKEWEQPEHVNAKLMKELAIRRAAKMKRINIHD
jgi:hypothetical protein